MYKFILLVCFKKNHVHYYPLPMETLRVNGNMLLVYSAIESMIQIELLIDRNVHLLIDNPNEE